MDVSKLENLVHQATLSGKWKKNPTTHKMGRNICKSCNKVAINSTPKKANNPIFKMGKILRHFSKNIQMAHRHIGSTKRYHLIPIMMAVIKKMANDKCWWGCREIRSCLHWGEESKMTQLLWQVLQTFLIKLNTELRSSNSTTRYTLKRTENRFRHLFTAA